MNETTYTKSIHWTESNGTKSTVSASSLNPNAAERKAWKDAVAFGWKPRRWWQWWRWDDTPNPRDSQ